MSFIDELKRRRVVRVVVAYGAIAFAVGQAATSFFPALHMPQWSVTLVVALCVLGFPIAAVLAWAFDITDAGIVRADEAVQLLPRRPSKARQAVAAAVIVLALGLGITLALRRGTDDRAIDPNLIAVLPFKVSGDASLAYLREGMMDLLSPVLAIEEGTRAVDPRSSMSAWRRVVSSDQDDLTPDSAMAVGMAVGAGRVLLGSVVGTPSNITLTAAVYSVPDGAETVTAKVIGSPDTLPALIDNLTAQLLSLAAGESKHRLSSLTSTSLDAVKEYLVGQSHFRQAKFTTAATHFDNAVEMDSTFALAALGLRLASGWGAVQGKNLARSSRLVRAYRDRLAPGDRDFALAMVGASDQPRSYRQVLDDWNRVVTLYPDRAEAWFQQADVMVHYGGLADVTDAPLQSKRGFDRALALDSSFTPALAHLIDHESIETRDTIEFRRLIRIMDRTSTPDVAPYQYWTRVKLGGDSVTLREFRAGLDTMSGFFKSSMALFAQLGVGTIDDAELAVESALRTASTPAEKDEAFLAAHRLYMNTGRLDDAHRILDQATPLAPLPWYSRAIMAAITWDGDTTRARVAADSISRNLARAAPGTESIPLRSGACTLGQWRLRQRSIADYDRILALLQSQPAGGVLRPQDQLCVPLLRALRAAAFNEPDAAELLERLDSIAGAGFGGWVALRDANATIAQLREARGELSLAARAQRRFAVNIDSQEYLSTWRRERGRFALAQGDTAEAIRYWTDYLALQTKAEGDARERMLEIRRQLAQITGERR